jgi:hypothetical protein
MNRSQLQKLLTSRVRLYLTKRKRGKFVVTIPGAFTKDGLPDVRVFNNKRHAVNFLIVKLPMLKVHTFSIEHLKADAELETADRRTQRTGVASPNPFRQDARNTRSFKVSRAAPF